MLESVDKLQYFEARLDMDIWSAGLLLGQVKIASVIYSFLVSIRCDGSSVPHLRTTHSMSASGENSDEGLANQSRLLLRQQATWWMAREQNFWQTAKQHARLLQPTLACQVTSLGDHSSITPSLCQHTMETITY